MPPKVGQVINNKYRLIRNIGDGGMGTVYEARHETLGTTVALKFLHLEFTRREGLVQRFLQEARASARIQSPHVVRVVDVDQTADSDVFIVLEYLEGKTLQALYEELYRAGQRLSYQEGLDYAEQMLDGLEAAHEAGIVHRDLKPDNVMITLDAKGLPLVKLLDFGIAKLKVIGGSPGKPGSAPVHDGGSPGKPGSAPMPPGLTRPGVMMGTPEYMAPEQASSADTVDVRADIFSLGVIIFEMLGGQRPVGGDDPHELAAAYRSGKVSQLVDLVPGISPGVAAAVHRAMAADPRDRFATVAEMREAIGPFASAGRPPSPSRLRVGGTIGVGEVSIPPTAARAALPPSPPAPGGVAKTWPPDEGPLPAAARGGGTVVDEPAPAERSSAVRGDLTHRMDPAFYESGSRLHTPGLDPRPSSPVGVPPNGSVAVLAPSPGRRRRRSGSNVLGVVLLAAGVAGVVTGGVYLASRTSSSSRDDDPPPALAPAPVVAVAPQAPAQPAEPSPPVPAAPAPTPAVAPKQGHVGPRPKPAPSGSSAVEPSLPPPPALIIPSAFPFPNPFQQTPAPPGSGSPQPQEPPLFPLP